MYTCLPQRIVRDMNVSLFIIPFISAVRLFRIFISPVAITVIIRVAVLCEILRHVIEYDSEDLATFHEGNRLLHSLLRGTGCLDYKYDTIRVTCAFLVILSSY
jgi:hypothetical protein